MSTELIDAFVEKYASLSGIAHVAENADAVAPIVVECAQGGRIVSGLCLPSCPMG